MRSASAALNLGERHATPRLTCQALARAINAGNLEVALACFAPDACLVGLDGSAAHGVGAIRTRLGELIAHGARVEIELFGVLIVEDLALAHERWGISYAQAAEAAPVRAPSPTLVLRLLEGEWKLAIACPWGKPASPPLEAILP